MVIAKDLMDQFVGERVMIITTLETSMINDMGEEEFIPRVFYAEMLAIDDTFMYLGDKGIPIIMLNLSQISYVERSMDDFDNEGNELILPTSDDTIN